MIHNIKIKECYANNIVEGKKKFEVRLNDRDYQVGDYLEYTVIDENGNFQTTAPHELDNKKYKIIYIHAGLGMREDYVVLGIEPYKREE